MPDVAQLKLVLRLLDFKLSPLCSCLVNASGRQIKKQISFVVEVLELHYFREMRYYIEGKTTNGAEGKMHSLKILCKIKNIKKNENAEVLLEDGQDVSLDMNINTWT